MSEKVEMEQGYVPKGYHTLTPYLAIHGVPSYFILKEAFGAAETEIQKGPDGRIHAELKIGDSMLMVGEKPADQQPLPTMIYMYFDEVDTYYERAIKAGGKSIEVPSNQDYGDRRAAVEDSSGNQWWIATRLQKVGGRK